MLETWWPHGQHSDMYVHACAWCNAWGWRHACTCTCTNNICISRQNMHYYHLRQHCSYIIIKARDHGDIWGYIMQKCLVIQNPYICSIKHCEYGPLSQPIVLISGTCTGVYMYVFPWTQSHDSTGQDKTDLMMQSHCCRFLYIIYI